MSVSFLRSVKCTGQAQSPAYLIALILRMYPKLVIQDNPKDEISQMQMAQQATEILLAGLRRMENSSRTMAGGNCFLVSAVKRVERAVSSLDPGGIRGRTGEQHWKSGGGGTYGKELENSATELERFAACAFAHFLQYGLKIEERQEYEFRQADLAM